MRGDLADLLVSQQLSEELIQEGVRGIHQDVLARSRYLRTPNFTAMHPADLELLFNSYDQRFFANRIRSALGVRPLRFRLSSRMTKASGKTTLFVARGGEEQFEIAIAVGMLFDGFKGTDRQVTVCGLQCEDRLEAVQRILEHEIVHLAEILCWKRSDCTAVRFQEIASRLFRHKAHTHQLITRRERASDAGVRVGVQVRFSFEGKRLTGRVNRITKRATVLVEDPEGARYSDGQRYKAYYVPIGGLEPVESE
jgi:hypothetical protein